HEVLIGPDIDRIDVVRIQHDAVAGADERVVIVVTGRLVFVQAVDAGRQIGKRVRTIAIRSGRIYHVPLAIEQVNGDARDGRIVLTNDDAAGNRAREQFAEIVIESVVAVVERGTGDFIHGAVRLRVGGATVIAGGVFTIKPAVRLNFVHAVSAGR